MDFEKFKERVGSEMDTPTDEQHQLLVQGEDSIHVTVGIGYILRDGSLTARDTIRNGEHFIYALDLIESRGAKRGDDYIITVYGKEDSSFLYCSIHTTHAFLCNEDFDLSLL